MKTENKLSPFFFLYILDLKKIGNIGNIVDYQLLTSATERQQNGNCCRFGLPSCFITGFVTYQTLQGGSISSIPSLFLLMQHNCRFM